jgi:hypothetical protein
MVDAPIIPSSTYGQLPLTAGSASRALLAQGERKVYSPWALQFVAKRSRALVASHECSTSKAVVLGKPAGRSLLKKAIMRRGWRVIRSGPLRCREAVGQFRTVVRK